MSSLRHTEFSDIFAYWQRRSDRDKLPGVLPDGQSPSKKPSEPSNESLIAENNRLKQLLEENKQKVLIADFILLYRKHERYINKSSGKRFVAVKQIRNRIIHAPNHKVTVEEYKILVSLVAKR